VKLVPRDVRGRGLADLVDSSIGPSRFGMTVSFSLARRLLGVHTPSMDSRRVVWDKQDRHHIEAAHPERRITKKEVDDVLNDPNRLEGSEDVRGGQSYRPVLGRTQDGRVLYVVYVSDPRGRYPVHGRQAGRRTQRRFETK
jgi:hypothetical protein